MKQINLELHGAESFLRISVTQSVKKFRAFHGARMFSVVFTRAVTKPHPDPNEFSYDTSTPYLFEIHIIFSSRGRSSSPSGGQEFSLFHVVQTGSGAYPASYPMGTGGYFSGVNAAEAWSWPLPLTSAEVNRMWVYTSTPPYVFMA
jgi:hypothetical protein